MTFILILGNREQFIQISDRRLTVNGKLEDDESNKATVFVCRNARLAVSFTGLARVGNFSTSRWLLDAIYDCSPPDYKVAETLTRLKERATKDFQTIPLLKKTSATDKRLSIVFSGYLYHHTPPLAGYAVLTNYQNFRTGRDDAQAWDHFELELRNERRPPSGKLSVVQRFGVWPAMTTSDEAILRQLLEECKPDVAIANKGIDILRKLADRPRAKGLVGKQLLVVIIPRDLEEHPSTWYDSYVVSNRSYMPNFIVTLGDNYRVISRDFSAWIKDSTGAEKIMSVPKVRPNAPCPCKSGKKYKHCHGPLNTRLL